MADPEFSTELELAKSGDRKVFAEVVRRYGPRVNAIVRERLNAFLRRYYDTADLRQSVILDFYRDLPGFEDRGESAFRAWLDIRVKNKVRLKFRRHLGRTGGKRESLLGDEVGLGLRDDSPCPVTRASGNEEKRALRAGMDGLSERYREILRLRYEGELSFAEAAKWMKLPSPDAARKLHARALMDLRNRMQSESPTR